MKLILLRHSIRDDIDNPEKYVGHNNNCPISTRGIELCHSKASKLKYEPTHIITSPFLRTIQTAEVYKLYFPDSNFMIDCLLSEGQNCHRPSFEQELLDQMDLAGIKYPETISDIMVRCKNFLLKLMNKGSASDIYLISTHGIIYNLILQLIFPQYYFKTTESPLDYIPTFCDTSVLEYNKEIDYWTILETDIKNLEILQITNEVLRFWFPSSGFHKFWFDKSVDDIISHKYSELPNKALLWTQEDEELNFDQHIAKIIILDQFTRNLYRDIDKDSTKYEQYCEYNNEALKSSLRLLEKLKKFSIEITTQKLIFGLMPLRHSRKTEYLDMLIAFCESPTVNIDDNLLWLKFVSTNKKCLHEKN
jgi:uncharacterized protein (DUF924 family)/broad specificity phosphatase PhoE